jgi:gas vesicle protein
MRSLTLNRPPENQMNRMNQMNRDNPIIRPSRTRMNRLRRTINRFRGRLSYPTISSNQNVLGRTIEELNAYNNHPNNIRFKNIHINQLNEPYKSKMEYLKKLKYNTPLTNEAQRNVNKELEELQKEVNRNKEINNELDRLQANNERRQRQIRLSASRKAAKARVMHRRSNRK